MVLKRGSGPELWLFEDRICRNTVKLFCTQCWWNIVQSAFSAIKSDRTRPWLIIKKVIGKIIELPGGCITRVWKGTRTKDGSSHHDRWKSSQGKPCCQEATWTWQKSFKASEGRISSSDQFPALFPLTRGGTKNGSCHWCETLYLLKHKSQSQPLATLLVTLGIT